MANPRALLRRILCPLTDAAHAKAPRLGSIVSLAQYTMRDGLRLSLKHVPWHTFRAILNQLTCLFFRLKKVVIGMCR